MARRRARPVRPAKRVVVDWGLGMGSVVGADGVIGVAEGAEEPVV